MGKGVLSAENHLSFFCIIGKITLRRRGKYCQREPAAEDTIPAGPGSQPWQPIIWAISLFICVLYSFWIIFEISFRLFSPQKVMNAANPVPIRPEKRYDELSLLLDKIPVLFSFIFHKSNGF